MGCDALQRRTTPLQRVRQASPSDADAAWIVGRSAPLHDPLLLAVRSTSSRLVCCVTGTPAPALLVHGQRVLQEVFLCMVSGPGGYIQADCSCVVCSWPV